MAKSAWQQAGRFNNNRGKTPRLDDLLPMHKFKSGVFYNLRFIGAPLTFAEHWIKIITNAGNETSVRKLCLSYDHATGDFKGKCPYCDTLGDTPRVVTLQNAIDRKLQKNEPARKPKPLKSESQLDALPWAETGEFYFKEKDSETWTPVVPLRLTSSPSQRINDYAALNKKTDKKGNESVYGPEDPDYGFDLQIKYDENQSAANAYFVNKAKNNYLTDEEMDYPIYDLAVEEVEKFAVAQKNADELFEKLVDGDGGKGGSKGGGRDRDDRGGKSGGKNRRDAKGYLGDIDDDDDDGDNRPGMDDNDDDDAPRGRSSGRGRSRDDDDDPPARGRGKSGGRSRDDDDDPPARGRGRSRDDDEDDAPRGGRGSSRGRSRDDNEDDEPPARGRGRSRDDNEDDEPPARGRGRTSSRMDDDEDEPPARGRGRSRDDDEDEAPRGRSGGRGRSRDDDDEPRGRSGGRGGRRDDGLDLD